MIKFKFILLSIAFLLATFFSFYVLQHENSLVAHPKGLIAHQEWILIVTNVVLMLLILIPTFVLVLAIAWKYRASNQNKRYEPEQKHGGVKEILLWIIPSIVVAVMAVITWDATHELDPYKPIEGENTLTIQVIALDWKWVFIYPEQKIATINFAKFPQGRPIHFELTADNSPMNSFWIPQLSGQIYCMTGMVTPLYIRADSVGKFSGKAAEINGEGYARMTFTVEATKEKEFEDWISNVKKSPQKLTKKVYKELIRPTINHPIALYSSVDDDLFMKVVKKYTDPQTKELWEN